MNEIPSSELTKESLTADIADHIDAFVTKNSSLIISKVKANLSLVFLNLPKPQAEVVLTKLLRSSFFLELTTRLAYDEANILKTIIKNLPADFEEQDPDELFELVMNIYKTLCYLGSFEASNNDVTRALTILRSEDDGMHVLAFNNPLTFEDFKNLHKWLLQISAGFMRPE